MKKVFSILAVAVAMMAFGNVQAQNLSVNIGYAPQSTKSTTTLMGSNTNSTMDMTGFFAGVTYNSLITRNFGVAFGLQARYNYKTITNTLLSATQTVKHTQILLDVPVLLNFGIQLGNDARVSVFAGPALTFAVKGNTHTSENVLNTSNDLNWYGENSNNQQLDLMGAAGVAFQFKTIRLFGGYRMGFLDLDKRDNVKTTNSGMFVSLSYAL